WKDTHGDALSELCAAASEKSRQTALLRDQLILSWEDWPLKHKGTANDWVQFLRVLGVKDGLTRFHKQLSMWSWECSALLDGAAAPESIERFTGREWRRELQLGQYRRPQYLSGRYGTKDTLTVLTGQAQFSSLNDDAKLAYARLIMCFLSEARPEAL